MVLITSEKMRGSHDAVSPGAGLDTIILRLRENWTKNAKEGSYCI